MRALTASLLIDDSKGDDAIGVAPVASSTIMGTATTVSETVHTGFWEVLSSRWRIDEWRRIR